CRAGRVAAPPETLRLRRRYKGDDPGCESTANRSCHELTSVQKMYAKRSGSKVSLATLQTGQKLDERRVEQLRPLHHGKVRRGWHDADPGAADGGGDGPRVRQRRHAVLVADEDQHRAFDVRLIRARGAVEQGVAVSGVAGDVIRQEHLAQ